MRRMAFLGLLLLGGACSASANKHQLTPGTDQLTGREAWAIVDEIRDAGYKGKAPKPVTTFEEVISTFERDETRRFESAADFVALRNDGRSAGIRAALELAHAEAGEIAANLYASFIETEREALKSDEISTRERTGRERRVAHFQKAQTALEVLTRGKLENGERLAKTALKQYPDSPYAHIASAMAYRLHDDWSALQRELAQLDKAGVEHPMLSYLRGTTAFHRDKDRAAARQFFAEALEQDPGFVRAQAHLVIAQDGVGGMHNELKKLRKMNERHFVDIVAGPSIDAEFDHLMVGMGK